MTETLTGTVDFVVFSSADGVFSVFSVKVSETGKRATVAGEVGTPRVGQHVEMRGCWTRHPRFGMQFKAESMLEVRPDSAEDIENYLASGEVAGIGPALAARIVATFGKKTLEIMDDNIEALLNVPGIGPSKLETIRKSYEAGAALREIVILLQSVGVPVRFAKEMQKAYGEDFMDVIRKEPYRMVRDIPGMGFRMADAIALAEGTSPQDEERIIRGILFVITQYSMEGHCCVPDYAAYRAAAELLRIDEELVKVAGGSAVEIGEIPSIWWSDRLFLYTPLLYEAETGAKDCIRRLLSDAKYLGSAKLAIRNFEKRNHVELADEQREAVDAAMRSGLLIITGGPGTGKTTLIQAIITAAEEHGQKIRLMAPTGRAAKRLSIASGRNADTIHKALEASMRGDRTFFGKNESDPLDEDLLIVDEASMIDMLLFYRLLMAMKDGARLILVGDIDQLPPVGPGKPLANLIDWGDVPTVRLRHIFRQQEGSGIIESAARIREGMPPVEDEAGEFVIQHVANDEDAFRAVMDLCREFHYEEEDMKWNMQVLSPMYKGPCGVDRLNRAIQQYVQDAAAELKGFRPEDKVMQKKNDYEKGVYNGDIGIVWMVSEGKTFVRFQEKEVVYEGDEKNDLQLAYATTVHKSQGSEYDTVILVLLPSQSIMLQRNLIYTGVTRAAKKTILVTAGRAVDMAVRNHRTAGRCSLFLPLLAGEADE